MRERWKISTLSSVCTIKPPKSEARQRLSDNDLVSFVPMNDLGIRQKNVNSSDERPLLDVAGSYTYFADGDVLLAKITPCFENGKLGIATRLRNGVGFGSSEFIVFRPSDEIDPEFLFYFLSQDSFRDAGARVMFGAVGHKRVPKEFIENYPIPLPPLSEQKHIVAILDEAFTGIEMAIANTDKNLANARELVESYLSSIVSQRGKGWQVKYLGEIAEFKNGLNFTKNSKGERIRIVGVKDFKLNYWVPVDELATAQIDGKLNETYVLREKDILLVRSNGNKQLIGRCVLTGTLKEKISFSGFTIRARVTAKEVIPEFLAHFLKAGQVREQLVKSGGGTNISSLNQKSLAALPVRFPTREQQAEIVRRIVENNSESERLQSIYQQKLSALGELKQSLLQKAFSGELTEIDREVQEAVA